MIGMMILAGLAVLDDPAASARAEADALIAAAGAEGVFENVTADTVPTLRHLQSGLTCHFTPGEATNSVSVFPELDGVGRGDNVGCNTRGQGMDATIYATRYARDYSAADVLDDAVAAILHRWPDAQAYEDGFPLLTSPDQDEPPAHAVFTVTALDASSVTFVLVQHHEAWSYKMRGTHAGGDAITAGLIGGMMFMNALGHVRREP